jgi:hypothetical protein
MILILRLPVMDTEKQKNPRSVARRGIYILTTSLAVLVRFIIDVGAVQVTRIMAS